MGRAWRGAVERGRTRLVKGRQAVGGDKGVAACREEAVRLAVCCAADGMVASGGEPARVYREESQREGGKEEGGLREGMLRLES